jgi:heat shock protein HslJ
MKSPKVVMVIIIALGIFLTVTACQLASPLEDYTWILTSYSYNFKAITALPDTEVMAFFSSKDKTVSGSAGCNSYGGKYELDRLTLSFPGPLASTLMACSDAINAQESEYLKILQKADSFEMDHGNLIIHSGNDRLNFKRGSSTEPTISKWGE